MSSAVISASAGDGFAGPSQNTDAAHMLRLRVLNDIHDDRITRLPSGVFLATSDTVLADHEQGAYIAEVQQLLAASWVMESNRTSAGGRILRLTTLGELRRLGMLAEQRTAVAS